MVVAAHTTTDQHPGGAGCYGGDTAEAGGVCGGRLRLSDDLRMRVFCRGTAQRLREVRRRVEAAKLDVEDIIRHAKVGQPQSGQ